MNFWKEIWDNKGKSDSNDLLWLCGREHLDITWDSKKESHYIKDLIDFQETDKILEVGCGAGFLSREFQTSDFTGIDYSKPLIEKHKKLYPEHNVFVSESNVLPFEDNQFDKLFCSGVFQYLPDLQYTEDTIKEFIRVTKKSILILDLKKQITNPNHYCIELDTLEKFGFKVIDCIYDEMKETNYNTYLELK
tara:strand:- start:10483 stop:11058 length:576 start_codon:yes stop_codon:yes gene_type:complete